MSSGCTQTYIHSLSSIAALASLSFSFYIYIHTHTQTHCNTHCNTLRNTHKEKWSFLQNSFARVEHKLCINNGRIIQRRSAHSRRHSFEHGMAIQYVYMQEITNQSSIWESNKRTYLLYLNMRVCVCACIFVCVCVCVRVYIYACVCACIYIRVCTYMCRYTCIYTHTHTNTVTYIYTNISYVLQSAYPWSSPTQSWKIKAHFSSKVFERHNIWSFLPWRQEVA